MEALPIRHSCSKYILTLLVRVAYSYRQLHVQRIHHTYSKPDIATEARKLMHRFTEEQVSELVDEAEGHS